MNVVAFFSSKGAPGTTTAAMLAASLWPRPALLADCDPAGGDLGLRLPAPDGRPLDLSRGVLSLLPVARRGLGPDAVLEHVQQVLGGGEVLAGMTGPEQAAAAGPVWSTIAGAFGTLPERDVLVDVGRLDSRSPVLPVAVAAQLAVCVLDSSLTGVYSTRARLRALLPALQAADGSGPRVGLVVRSRDRRDAAEAGQVLQGEFPSVAYWGRLPEDAAGAGIFAGRAVSRPERTMLARAGAEIVAAMQDELGRLLITRLPAAPYGFGGGEPNGAAAPKRSRSEERRLGRTKAKK